MDIKVEKKCIVGTVMTPRKVGEVVRGVDDAEAKALITVGYAKAVKPEAPAKEAKPADENADKGNATENANKGDAPKTKAK